MTSDKILAIDFGTKRIGLALSYGTLAEPLPEISNDDATLLNLHQLCEREAVTKIVMGLSEGDMAQQTEEFAHHLAEKVKLPIEFTDETLSSLVATRQLKEQGKTSPRQRSVVDSRAAANFLQEYLDDHQS